MRKIFSVMAICIIFISSVFSQTNEYEDDYRILYDMREGRLPHSSPPTDDDIYHYDVIHEDIDIKVLFATEEIQGVVTMTAQSFVDNLSTAAIDLYDNMVINSVTSGTTVLSYLHQNNQVFVTLASPVNTGEEFSITIDYEGEPMVGGLQAFSFETHAGIPMATSLSEPEEARSWWPCKDVPWDKFTADIRFTVPDYMIAASNGLLTEVIQNPDNTKTYHWVESYPITTYLISICATNYVHFGETYQSLFGDSMQLDYYVFPEHLTQAQNAFATVPDIMEYYESVFGEYPFIDEKYGHAIFNWSGGMEHQTLTSIGSNILSPSYEWLYAHELSHMWWGDMLTCGTWLDIWLNEGFATYCDALYKQYAYGQTAFNSRMSSFKQSYFWEDNQNRFPIYDPEIMWGSTVYKKGAWIVHMLRYVGGEADFFDMLAQYRGNFEYSSAVTSDLQETVEAVYDTTMDWFFDEWVYMAGYPEYQWGYNSTSIGGNLYEFTISVRQMQELIDDTPIFTMPMPFVVNTPISDYNFTCWDSLQQQSFTFIVEGNPYQVTYDPDIWILDTRQNVPYFEPPLTLTMDPDSTTLTVPANGGTISFHAELSNNSTSNISTDVWSGVILPDGSVYGPIILRTGMNLAPGAMTSRDMAQNVPASAPSGDYTYFFLAGSYRDSTTVAADAFDFTKQ